MAFFSLINRGCFKTTSERRKKAMKHKVSICVSQPGGKKEKILKAGSGTWRSRLLDLLFGKKVGVIIMTPGKTVKTVEIKEVRS